MYPISMIVTDYIREDISSDEIVALVNEQWDWGENGQGGGRDTWEYNDNWRTFGKPYDYWKPHGVVTRYSVSPQTGGCWEGRWNCYAHQWSHETEEPVRTWLKNYERVRILSAGGSNALTGLDLGTGWENAGGLGTDPISIYDKFGKYTGVANYNPTHNPLHHRVFYTWWQYRNAAPFSYAGWSPAIRHRWIDTRVRKWFDFKRETYIPNTLKSVTELDKADAYRSTVLSSGGNGGSGSFALRYRIS